MRWRDKGLPRNWDVTAEQMRQQGRQVSTFGAAEPGDVGQTDASVAMQQTRHARRVYVGNLGNVVEEDLKQFFNGVFLVCEVHVEGGAVLSVYVNHERKYAFVEFRTIELAEAAMQLDGMTLDGQALKISRPNDFNPAAVPATIPRIHLDLSKLGIVSNRVPDSPNKIFIGGIPHNVTEQVLAQLLGAFGALKGLHLVTDSTCTGNKGYGFCEYSDPAVTDVAVQGLDGLALGDRTLTVRRAHPTGPSSAAPAASSYGSGYGQADRTSTGANSIPLGQGSGSQPSYAAPAAAAPAPAMAAPTSRAMLLSNTITSAQLMDDSEYKDISSDIAGECARLGSMQQFEMPRHGPFAGKALVMYASAADARSAISVLHGRPFDGRTVEATLLPETEWPAAA